MDSNIHTLFVGDSHIRKAIDDKLFEGEVDSATFPGSDGTFQVLNDHAPLVSSLGLGELKYQYKEKDQSINIKSSDWLKEFEPD